MNKKIPIYNPPLSLVKYCFLSHPLKNKLKNNADSSGTRGRKPGHFDLCCIHCTVNVVSTPCLYIHLAPFHSFLCLFSFILSTLSSSLYSVCLSLLCRRRRCCFPALFFLLSLSLPPPPPPPPPRVVLLFLTLLPSNIIS